MKKTKISAENSAAIAAILAKVQTGRALNDLTAQNVINLAARAEKRLDNALLPLSYRSGVVYEFEAAGADKKAYKYPIATKRVTMKRGVKCWYLISVEASQKFPKQPQTQRMALSDEQLEIVKKKNAEYVVNGKVA